MVLTIDGSDFNPAESFVDPVNVVCYPVQSHATHTANADIQQLNKICTALIHIASTNNTSNISKSPTIYKQQQ